MISWSSCHHVLINVKTARCIQDHQIVAVLAGMLQSCPGDVRRLVAVTHGKDFHSLLFSIHLELFDSGRTVYVTGHKERFLPFQFIFSRQFCGGRCLTCTLETCHHNNSDGASRLELDLCGLGSHEGNQLLIDDLDDHLSRVQPVHHVLPDGTLLHILNEALYDFEVDIRGQKRPLDLLHSLFDVVLCQPSLAPQIAEHILKFFCQTVKSHS